MLQKKKSLSYENALMRVATLCSRCEQCTPDILKKLSAWGLSVSDSEKLIKRMEELNFIDDHRFAKAYAHDKLCFSGWGRRKIAQGLWLKKLPRDIVEAAFDDIEDEEYFEVALRVVRSKARSYKEWPLGRANKVKLLKYAMSRGFEYPIVADIIRNRLVGEDESVE